MSYTGHLGRENYILGQALAVRVSKVGSIQVKVLFSNLTSEVPAVLEAEHDRAAL